VGAKVQRGSGYRLSECACTTGVVCAGDFLFDGRRNKGRMGVLFLAGAAAVVAGLILPVRPVVIDVLLIFSVSLTAGVLVISFSARQVRQVRGFPLLAVAATTLRMGLATAASRLILLRADAGNVAGFCGRLFVSEHYVLSALLFFFAALAVFGTICHVVRYLGRVGAESIAYISGKSAGLIEGSGVSFISEGEAEELRRRVTETCSFYAAMGVTGGFLLCGAVIELLVVLFTVGFAFASSSTLPGSSPLTAQMYTGAALGVGLVIQLSSLLIAVACKGLVRNSSIALPDESGFEPVGGKGSGIQAAAGQLQALEQDSMEVAAEFVELPDPEPGADIEAVASPGMGREDPRRRTGDKCEASSEENQAGHDWPRANRGGSDCWEAVLQLIENASSGASGTVLLGAQKVSQLPVTSAVDVAVRLARKGRRCLLVDADHEGDTIAKVFEVGGGSGLKPDAGDSGIPTCIKGLCVRPASAFDAGSGVVSGQELQRVIASAANYYYYIIIYAPKMGMVSDWAEVAESIDGAVLFGQEDEGMYFERLLVSGGCTVRRQSGIAAGAV